MDRVLAAARPAFDDEPTSSTSRGARSTSRRRRRSDLGSERDQTFLLLDATGAPLAVMKVSNAAEDPATLDMEALAVLHAHRVDPRCRWRSRGASRGAPADSVDPADRRVADLGRDGDHHVRMYAVLPGRGRIDAHRAVRRRARRLGRDDGAPRSRPARLLPPGGAADDAVGRPARGADAGAARRDPRRATTARSSERVLDRFDAAVVPVWPSLRAQVVHTDLTTDNALADDDGHVTGIVDFGDMSHSALVDRPRVAARLAAQRPDWRRAVPLRLGSSSTATSASRRSNRSSCGSSASCWPLGPRSRSRSRRGGPSAASRTPTFAERYNAPVAAHDRDAARRRLGRGGATVRRRAARGRPSGPSPRDARPSRAGDRAADLRRPDPRRRARAASG